jgi:hypothetical protein
MICVVAAACTTADPADSNDTRALVARQTALRTLVEHSPTLARVEVLGMTRDAVVEELDFAGLHWRIYYDQVSARVIDGEAALASGTVAFRRPPTRCEAFRDGARVDAQLSICTSGEAAVRAEPGDELIVATRQRRNPVIEFSLRVTGRTVDLSPFLPATRPVDSALAAMRDLRDAAARR